MSEQEGQPGISFAKLLTNQDLLSALDKLGFTEATPVQALTIPPALQKKDLVVKAKTGSGKTLAFGLPMLSLLAEKMQSAEVKHTFGIVIAPTRELAVQISEVFSGLIAGLTPTLLIGGEPYPKQKRQMSSDPRVMVGTVGRVLDFMRQGYLDLSRCEFFVLDEADEMFSMGFFEDVQTLVRQIPNEAQGMFVSATISPRVESLAREFLKSAERIQPEQADEELLLIEHYYCQVGSEIADKPTALCDILEHLNPESAIVFCNTKSETELVESFMRRRAFDARRMNADLNQKQRTRIMTKIRGRELRYLVATDIAARGIDIEQIELIINFSVHDQPELYIHRTGRTGRAGRAGKAISLVSAHDFMNFKMLQKEVSVELKEMPLPTQEELSVARLGHLKEILKAPTASVRERDVALAKRILQELGGLEHPAPELEKFVALLTQFAVEHFVNIEAVSLEEELASEGPKHSQQRRPHRESRGSGRSRNDSRRDNRDGQQRGRGGRGRGSR